METTSALTKNTFKISSQSTSNLNGLDSAITQLQLDYEEMKKTREEAKQALQAKFDEVYGKIKQTKDIIVQESLKTNESMIAFQNRFNNEIAQLEKRQTDQHQSFAVKTDGRLDTLNKLLEDLDARIEREKQERIETERQNLQEIQEKLNLLTSNFEWERNTRVENEKMMEEKIKQDCQQIANKIDSEDQERIKKVGELERHVKHELKSQYDFLETFKAKTINEFNFQTQHIENEMNNRFNHQNELVDDLRSTTSTIQETLKILGKDI